MNRYRSPDEDSGRWEAFRFRDGDIVISTRSKHGTTWMQMICALLVFRTHRLPAPLAELSPWLDWLGSPLDDVIAGLEAQPHRRIVKTHTPLDGIPLDPRATYVVVARHPLDAAVSLHHQGDNLDRDRIAELTGRPGPRVPDNRPSLTDWLAAWIEDHPSPQEQLDSLPGVLWHLADAWSRRAQPNVVLVHYDDLLDDLPGQMAGLARRLDVPVDDDLLPVLAEAASFDQMRSEAERLAPDQHGILRDRRAFFRRGTSGAGQWALTDDQLARYQARGAELASADLLAWLRRTPPT